MSVRTMSRLDMLLGYLNWLEGQGLIDFGTLRPFDFKDVALGFALQENRFNKDEPLEQVTDEEEYEMVMAFSEVLDGDGVMLPAEEPTHDDLVVDFLGSWWAR